MSESRLRHTLLALLPDSAPIENMVGSGIPDVWTPTPHPWWLELKHAHEWPKRPTTPVRFNHYTTAQRSFGVVCIKHQHPWGLLVAVEDVVMLFVGREALLVGRKPKAWMLDRAVWVGGWDLDGLTEALGRVY